MNKKCVVALLLGLLVSIALLCGCSIGSCETCGDTKEVECSSCAGTIKVECMDCGGDTIKDCHVCDGDGVKFGACDTCNGSGTVRNPITWEEFSCGPCGGEGVRDVTCDSCGGTGDAHSACTSCEDGKVYCYTCNGTGKLPCSECSKSEYKEFMANLEEKENLYQQAVEKEKAGKLGEALKLFTELGAYKDSKSKVEEIEGMIAQQKINSKFELEGEWVSVSGEETDFFNKYSSDKRVGGFKIIKKDNSYRIYDALEDGYALGHNKTIVVENGVFTLNADLGDYDIKVFFSEEGNLIFEKYEEGKSELLQTFEVKKVSK